MRTPVAAALMGLSVAASCALPSAADKMKEVLAEHGTIDAEWQVRDDAGKKTHTYVLLRTERGTHETYALVVEDGSQEASRELVGGIDSTGCFLTEPGMDSPWIQALPTSAHEDTWRSGDKIRTRCLEYEETGAWAHIPEKDRKAAEPPPPPPAETEADAGATPDGGAAPPPDVDSLLPQ